MQREWNFVRRESATLEDMLSEGAFDGKIFAEWITETLAAHDIKKSMVVRKSMLNQTFAYQIMAGMRHPSRDKLIQLAFGIGLNINESCDLLERGGVNALRPDVRRDAIIAYCLEHHMDISTCNAFLKKKREKPLLANEKRA